MKIDKPTLFIGAGLGVFGAGLIYLVATSLVPKTAREFSPTVMGEALNPEGSLVVDTVTIDASGSHWVFFSFSDGTVFPFATGRPWDVAVRRFNVVVSGGAIDFGAAQFSAVETVPETGYTSSEFGSDSTNAVLAEWYEYSWISHLMEPNGHIYAIETSDRKYAKIEFLSYYCPGMVSGCVTFRYAYQSGGGTSVSGTP